MLSQDLLMMRVMFDACRDGGGFEMMPKGAEEFSRMLGRCADQAADLEGSVKPSSCDLDALAEQASIMAAATNVVMFTRDRPLWRDDLGGDAA